MNKLEILNKYELKADFNNYKYDYIIINEHRENLLNHSLNKRYGVNFYTWDDKYNNTNSNKYYRISNFNYKIVEIVGFEKPKILVSKLNKRLQESNDIDCFNGYAPSTIDFQKIDEELAQTIKSLQLLRQIMKARK